jgi:predicted transcriptional regulator
MTLKAFFREASKMDEKAEKVLEAIRRKKRPYREADICSATRLSKSVVEKRLDQLKAAGLVKEVWINELPPFWELAENAPQ